MSGVAVNQLAGRNAEASDKSRDESQGGVVLTEDSVHLLHDLFRRVSPYTGSAEEVTVNDLLDDMLSAFKVPSAKAVERIDRDVEALDGFVTFTDEE